MERNSEKCMIMTVGCDKSRDEFSDGICRFMSLSYIIFFNVVIHGRSLRLGLAGL